MLTEDELGEFIEQRFTHTLFRLETLDHIEITADAEDFAAYQQGRPGPSPRPWLDVIRDEVAHGKHTYRVHVVRSPLSLYLRFCFEWGYAYNADAGEHIGIIDEAEQAASAELIRQDFWLIDGQHLLLMHYDRRGRFVGATVGADREISRYRACADAAWRASVAFETYWHGHPHEWRDKPAIAS